MPSYHDERSGWWLTLRVSDFVVFGVCCVWNAHDMMVGSASQKHQFVDVDDVIFHVSAL